MPAQPKPYRTSAEWFLLPKGRRAQNSKGPHPASQRWNSNRAAAGGELQLRGGVVKTNDSGNSKEVRKLVSGRATSTDYRAKSIPTCMKIYLFTYKVLIHTVYRLLVTATNGARIKSMHT
jgi:hypothetical protein